MKVDGFDNLNSDGPNNESGLPLKVSGPKMIKIKFENSKNFCVKNF